MFNYTITDTEGLIRTLPVHTCVCVSVCVCDGGGVNVRDKVQRVHRSSLGSHDYDRAKSHHPEGPVSSLHLGPRESSVARDVQTQEISLATQTFPNISWEGGREGGREGGETTQ